MRKGGAAASAGILKPVEFNTNKENSDFMDDSKGLSYFFLGLGVGVAVGLLFAPQSGEDTRGLIKSKAQEGGDYLKKRGEEVKESATEALDKGRDLVGRQRDQLNAAIDAGKQAYREAVSSTPGRSAAETL